MGARSYSSDNQPTYNKNSRRVPVYIPKDHALQNKDRPYYAENKDAAQALLAHIEGVLTGEDARAAQSYWSSLNQIVATGYNATEQAQNLQKRNNQIVEAGLNDSGDILNTRQIDALYIYSTERAILNKELGEKLNVQERAVAMRMIHNMAVNNAFGVESSFEGMAPKVASVIREVAKSGSYENIAKAVSIINNDIGQNEDAMDVAPLTSETRFENEVDNEGFNFYSDENEGVMTDEVRRQRLERILRSGLDIDLTNERIINVDNIRLAQSYSNLIEQIENLENSGENDASRVLRGRLLSAERLQAPAAENVIDESAILANAIINSPAYQAFANEVLIRTENGQSFKDIISVATASENDPLSHLDIIAETRQEAQIFSHVLDAVSMNGSRLPSPEKIQAITAQIRDDLSVAIYQRSPSNELKAYPKSIPQVDEEGRRFSTPHPYWEQYANGQNQSHITPKLELARELVLDDHKLMIKERNALRALENKTEENVRRLEQLETLPANALKYMNEKLGYVPLAGSTREYEPVSLSTARLLYAPTFGPESHKLKFNTIAVEAARFYKNEKVMIDQINGFAEFNKNAKNSERISLVMAKDDEHQNKAKIIEAAKNAGMKIVEVVSTQTSRPTIDMSSGTPRRMTIRENNLQIEIGGEYVDLYSSAGQQATRGALILVDPIMAQGQQRSMIGWQITQSLSRETLVFGINEKDYNVCQQIRRSVEFAKPTTILGEDGKALDTNETYKIAKEGAPRIADNNRRLRLPVADYNQAIDWKLDSPEGKLFMTRIIGHKNALNVAENYKAIDKISGRTREPVVNDLILASKMMLQDLKKMDPAQAQNIRDLYAMVGSKEMRRFNEVELTENAITNAKETIIPTQEKVFDLKIKKIIENQDYNPDVKIDIEGEFSKRIGQPVLVYGDSSKVDEIGLPKIAIIGSALGTEDESTIKKIDDIVKSAAQNKITIGIMEDGVGDLVLQSANKNGANVVMLRESAINENKEPASLNLSIGNKGLQAFIDMTTNGSAVSISTNIKAPKRVEEGQAVRPDAYSHKGDARRLADLRILTSIADSVIVASADSKDLAVYAAAVAGQHKSFDKNAGKSVAVIIPEMDVESITKYSGNFALARENGYVSTKTGTTSTSAFAHSTGGVTDPVTGLFVDAQKEQKTNPWVSPTYSTASWASPAIALNSEKQINDYVQSVAEGRTQPMQSNVKATGLTTEAIRLATIEKASDTTEKMARIYAETHKTPDPLKITPDQSATNDNDWRKYVKDVHNISESSIRIKDRKKASGGMEI